MLDVLPSGHEHDYMHTSAGSKAVYSLLQEPRSQRSLLEGHLEVLGPVAMYDFLQKLHARAGPGSGGRQGHGASIATWP